jgi:hypothetical protein
VGSHEVNLRVDGRRQKKKEEKRRAVLLYEMKEFVTQIFNEDSVQKDEACEGCLWGIARGGMILPSVNLATQEKKI